MLLAVHGRLPAIQEVVLAGVATLVTDADHVVLGMLLAAR